MKNTMILGFYLLVFSSIFIAFGVENITQNKQICKIERCVSLSNNQEVSKNIPMEYYNKEDEESYGEDEFNEEDLQREEYEDMEEEFVEEIETESEEKEIKTPKKERWWNFWI
jgi:UDP-3-O-acyl-N-acetylglucosamine deacetylase